MTKSDVKKCYTLVDADFLDNFFKDGWILLGTEEKKPNELIRTEYTLGHANPDQKVPESYSKYCKKCKEAGI